MVAGILIFYPYYVALNIFYIYFFFLLKLFLMFYCYITIFLPPFVSTSTEMASSCDTTTVRRRPPPIVLKPETKQATTDAAESPMKVPHISSWDKKLGENPKLLELFKAILDAVCSARTTALAEQQPMSFADYKPAEFLPGLSIGSQWDTHDEKFSHLATVMDDPSMVHSSPESSKVFHARDDDNTNILALFPQVRDYLDECVKTGKPTLIHCHAGINRSAILATAYYCYKTSKTLLEAIAHLVSLRPIILRNESFLAQLTIWAVENGFAKCE